MSLTGALRRAAMINPQGRAIVTGTDRRDWREVAQRVSALAGALRAEGLQPGQQVATLALNAPRYFELMLAVWWAGGVLVPLNTRLAANELNFILGHSESAFLVTDTALEPLGREAADSIEGLRACIVLGDDRYAAMIAHAPMADARRPLDSLAGIFYTGGTTGLPKGVELTHQNFAFAATCMQRDLRHDADTVYLHAAPLFHLADFGIGLGVTLGAGAHSFMHQFTPEGFYARLRQDGVTHIQLVPTMLAAVLDAPQRDDQLLAQVRSIGYGAAPVPQSLRQRLFEAFPNARIQQFYGMTECCGASVMLPAERHVLSGPMAGKLHATGQPIAGFEVRIARPDSSTCAANEPGEVQMRGPAVMRGYWKDPARTRETLADGWLRSGDVGYLDEDGFIHVVDRLKDMIISGGENIYCAEVENALTSHPGVLACAVLGLSDERWGERVHAVVVPKAGAALDSGQLDLHCRSLIAGYKVPRSYDIRSVPLPLSGVGKVQKNKLREAWLAKQEPGTHG